MCWGSTGVALAEGSQTKRSRLKVRDPQTQKSLLQTYLSSGDGFESDADLTDVSSAKRRTVVFLVELTNDHVFKRRQQRGHQGNTGNPTTIEFGGQ
ncbi:hypothetical protein D3C86_1844780 [compost metagenome]